MIGEFEQVDVLTAYPVKNENKFTGIKSMFISQSYQTFSSESNFALKSQWISEIKAQNIFQILGLLEIEPQIEAQEYIKSELGYQYVGNKGKYGYTFKVKYVKEYHDQLKKWSSKSLRIYLADYNNNIFANLVNGSVRGIDADLFEVEKMQLGTNDPAWTVIKVEFADSDEFDYVKKMDWFVNKLNPIYVTLSDVEIDGTDITLKAFDYSFGYAIDNLFKSEFKLHGIAALILSTTNLGDGQYLIHTDTEITEGNIYIESDRYYSLASSIDPVPPAYQPSFINGGGANTTDFIDSNSDGLADSFSKTFPGNSIATIETVSVYGRMQKVLQISSAGTIGIHKTVDYFKQNQNYKLSFKYSCGNSGINKATVLLIGNYGTYVDENDTIETTYGAIEIYESPTFLVNLNETAIMFMVQFNHAGMSVSIDELELIEV